jgi:radical SAM superfamily enzyme YgiQ (UPF0313 family)
MSTQILLINPPREVPQQADFPPLGLAYIASFLNRNGIKTCVIDAASFSWKRLKNVIIEKAPSIVGIPCWTLERGQSFKVARLVKEVFPQVKIIMGGHHATAFPEHMFKLADADVVVIGEGEITVLELAGALLNNGNLREIKGIAYLEDGKVIVNGSRDFINDLDVLPFPSYDDFNLDEYLGLPEIKERAAAIITSRGCPHRCTYCSASKFWRRAWRARSAENVLDEIEWLYRDYGVRAFLFFDDNFTVNKERAIKICQGILERNLHIKWVAESHVSHINKELLSWMKKSGCYKIDFGIESGSQKILKTIKKGQTIEGIVEAFKLTYEVGIKSRAMLMIGNPGENEESVEETIKLMRMINPYDTHSAQILWILPDTEIYELAKSKGIISDEFWLGGNSMVYYTGDHSVRELKILRKQLMEGLVNNRGGIKAYGEYLIRSFYYNYPILQKFREMLINFRKIGL